MHLATPSRGSRPILLLAALTLLGAGPALAQTAVDLRKLDPMLRSRLALGEAALAPSHQLRSLGTAAPQGVFDVFIRGDVRAEELQALGVVVRTDLGTIKTAFVPESALGAVTLLPDVQMIEGGMPVEPELDVSVPSTGVAGLRGPGPGFAGLNGNGIVVGDVDSGIDEQHGDFDDALGNTRIRYLWDQTVDAFPPPGYFYGNEWTAAQIDADLCTETDVPANVPGHGTHVMGIAAGDGSKTGNGQPAYKYVGMAPLADIVFVKTISTTPTIVDGVNYVFQKAAALGKPAVCNLSLGTHSGPHDGTSTFEQAISALTGVGKVVVKSAGNEANSNIHAEVYATPGGALARLNLPSASNLPDQVVLVEGYYDALDNISVRLTTPNGTILGPVARGASLTQTVATQGRIVIENGVSQTASGDYVVYIELRSIGTNISAGAWQIHALSVALGSTGEVDFWRSVDGIPGVPVFNIGQDNSELVSEPGNAFDVCTCGSWTTKRTWTSIDGNSYVFGGAVNPGMLSPFSSPGPTRDGRLKPDLTAPGSAILSALTADPGMPAVLLPYIAPDGTHGSLQGTSMSAPHLTGAIALIMQARGPLSPAQACNLLKATAFSDGFTGPVPNNLWGYGKLHIDVNTAAYLASVNVDAQEEAVELSWAVSGGSLGAFRAERRELGAEAYAPLTVEITSQEEEGLVRYRFRDESVAPGTSYEYRVWGMNSLGDAVAFGPYIAEVPQQQLQWALHRLAPNPAHGPVVLAFSAAARGPASVTIYDARGRKVAEPYRQIADPGRHTVTWSGAAANGSRLPRGLYLVVFRGGGVEAREKLLLLE